MHLSNPVKIFSSTLPSVEYMQAKTIEHTNMTATSANIIPMATPAFLKTQLPTIAVASNVTNMTRMFSVDTLYKIADALGVKAGDLLNSSLPASSN